MLVGSKTGVHDLYRSRGLNQAANDEWDRAKSAGKDVTYHGRELDKWNYNMEYGDKSKHDMYKEFAEDEAEHYRQATAKEKKHAAESSRLLSLAKEYRNTGTRKMVRTGAAGGGIAGAAAGALAGKGYSVYKRHKMKKQGATKKELAAHKKGDLRRIATGAGAGAVVGGLGGAGIGKITADRLAK